MDQKLLDYLLQLGSTEDLESAWSRIVAFFRAEGADSLVYAFGDVDRGEFRFLTDLPSWWMERYVQEDFARDDHALHQSLVRIDPFPVGIELVGKRLEGRPKRVVEIAAEDVGIRSGKVFPLRGLSYGKAGALTFATGLNGRDFRSLVHDRSERLHLAALLSHLHLERLDRQQRTGNAELSRREREVLLWLARGLRPESIASRLGIRRGTVDLHIARARRKLGAETATQAVALAVYSGAIEP